MNSWCSRSTGLLLLWLVAALFWSASTGLAHKPSDSYLTFRTGDAQMTGEWHLALRDLEEAIGLDANDDGSITWKELRAREPELAAYAAARLQVSAASGRGTVRMTRLLVDQHSDGAYAVLELIVDGIAIDQTSKVEVRYNALFDLDPSHRGLCRVEDEATSRLWIFSPETAVQSFDLGAPSVSSWTTLFHEGIWHIWTGYDHLLFLIALLLPGLRLRRGLQWQTERSFRPVLLEILKTVTAFTLAHSITLSLAALDIVRLPSRPVECAIAASVVLAAANNLVPIFSQPGWIIAFGFGLIHGFGFANALSDLGLAQGGLAAALFCFNLGVETGQLAIVALLLPLVLGFGRYPFYQQRLLPAGSVVIAVLAASWFAERALGFKVLSF